MISHKQIVTRDFLDKKNLSIYYKDRISDEEFGEIIAKSFVVLTPYKRETQSSVILVSYMHGTPVVSSNVGGLPEFVNDGKTGVIVDINASAQQWIEAISFVKTNNRLMSVNCRRYFEETFSGHLWSRYFKNILI
jgi:glycosyltransferase involved in cell wall biosynthesis